MTGVCSVCNKSREELGRPLQRCTGCNTRTYYCGSQCQRADWPTHRSMCGPESVWYDKHRKCMDGRMHEGRLELITWECPQEQTGWGHCLLAEADDLRRTFETRYNSDEERFFGYWPQGFRWTCCGLEGDITYGCDHHGTGSRPCTCDYCRGGQPLPERHYRKQSAGRMGLQLSRGPDPRSGSYSINIGL